MRKVTGEHFLIIEGDQTGPFDWEFGFTSSSLPVYFEVSSLHPDAGGLSHLHWHKGGKIDAGFVCSVEQAQAIIGRWTPERRRRFLTQEPAYWNVGDWVARRGWLTPRGRRKWVRACGSLYSETLAALSLVDSDFRHGITMDILSQLKIYALHGLECERAKAQGRDYAKAAEVEAAKEILCSPETPEPVRALFQEYERMIFNGGVAWGT